MITKEQATRIFRMARDLEDTGRLCSLSESDEQRREWREKNRQVQCALQDYLEALTALSAPAQEPVAMRHSFDGYGWMYIDSGHGSNWQERARQQYPDAEPVYSHPEKSQ